MKIPIAFTLRDNATGKARRMEAEAATDFIRRTGDALDESRKEGATVERVRQKLERAFDLFYTVEEDPEPEEPEPPAAESRRGRRWNWFNRDPYHP